MHVNKETSHLRVNMNHIVMEKVLKQIRTYQCQTRSKGTSGRPFISSMIREKRKCHQRSPGDGTQKQGRTVVETQSKLMHGKTNEWRKITHVFSVQQLSALSVFVNLCINLFKSLCFSKCYILNQTTQQTETKQAVQGIDY